MYLCNKITVVVFSYLLFGDSNYLIPLLTKLLIQCATSVARRFSRFSLWCSNTYKISPLPHHFIQLYRFFYHPSHCFHYSQVDMNALITLNTRIFQLIKIIRHYITDISSQSLRLMRIIKNVYIICLIQMLYQFIWRPLGVVVAHQYSRRQQRPWPLQEAGPGLHSDLRQLAAQ